MSDTVLIYRLLVRPEGGEAYTEFAVPNPLDYSNAQQTADMCRRDYGMSVKVVSMELPVVYEEEADT